MTTLVIFAALIYLVNALGLKEPVRSVIVVLLAIIGLVLWLVACMGVTLPACLRT